MFAAKAGESRIGLQPCSQLPTSSVVTPWARALWARPSRAKSQWLWTSMEPGQTSSPVASTSSRADALDRSAISRVPPFCYPDIGGQWLAAGAIDDQPRTDNCVEWLGTRRTPRRRFTTTSCLCRQSRTTLRRKCLLARARKGVAGGAAIESTCTAWECCEPGKRPSVVLIAFSKRFG